VIPTETHVNRAMRTVSELPFIPGCPIQVDMVTVVFPAGNVPGRLLIPRYSASWAARSGSRPGGQSRPTADYLGSLGALARGVMCAGLKVATYVSKPACDWKTRLFPLTSIKLTAVGAG